MSLKLISKVKTNKAQYDGVIHDEVQIPLLKKTLMYSILVYE